MGLTKLGQERPGAKFPTGEALASLALGLTLLVAAYLAWGRTDWAYAASALGLVLLFYPFAVLLPGRADPGRRRRG